MVVGETHHCRKPPYMTICQCFPSLHLPQTFQQLLPLSHAVVNDKDQHGCTAGPLNMAGGAWCGLLQVCILSLWIGIDLFAEMLENWIDQL